MKALQSKQNDFGDTDTTVSSPDVDSYEKRDGSESVYGVLLTVGQQGSG